MANNANPTTATPAAENPQAAVDAAVSAERNRLAEIDSVASLFDPALVQEAKYGETACDARELAFRAAKAAAAQGHEFLKNLTADNAASGAQSVEAVPGASASGSPESLPDARVTCPRRRPSAWLLPKRPLPNCSTMTRSKEEHYYERTEQISRHHGI